MKKLYLIGNAHIDIVWLWRWQDGFAEILATFRSALDRIKEVPDFKFTSACAVYYEWIEKNDPEMFEEIKQRVKEGRWNIVGGWFLQPDCNIPSGESFARHSLIGQRYFKEKFGITVTTGYNVDSFGHNASLPKILKKSGIDHYVFMRPNYGEKELKKDLFFWESDDGSKVLSYRIPWEYRIDSTRIELIKKIKEKSETDGLEYMAFYGVGNHGGGPTIRLMREIQDLGLEGLSYSTPDEYFKNVDTTGIETVKDELQHHARGCYSACSFVKRNNRACEQNLIAAEKFAVMAKMLVGEKYPDKKLNKAWKNLLFNQFHDLLAGCSIKKAYEDAGYLFGETMSISEQVINKSLQQIAWNIDTLGEETLPSYKNWAVWTHEVLGTPIVVFNPHAWRVTMPVAVYTKAKKVTDSDGKEIPFQIVRGDQTNIEDKYHTAFQATVEPFGYAVYRVFLEQESKESFEKCLFATENSLENNRIKVEFDRQTGDIQSFYDKESGKYIIDAPCRAILLDETDCDTWAHNKEKMGELVDVFGTPEFKIIEEGDVRTTLRIITKCGNSTLQREYSVFPDSKELRVKVKADFREKHKTLKFAFPFTGDKVISRIPYGTMERPLYTGEEPCGMWFAAGDLCVANDSHYGYDTENGEIRLSVLRGAIYADHYGFEHRDDFCEFMEQGIQECVYSVFPYGNNAEAEKKAAELNCGLRSIAGSFHKGKLPEKMSCIQNHNDNIVITAIKEAEDKNGNVVRFFEIDGKDTSASIKLFDKEINAEVGHHEIKTFSDDGRELNLIEWESKKKDKRYYDRL